MTIATYDYAALRDFGAALGEKFRFNWNAPILLSPHDKNTIYFGGNVVFKSTDFGKTWEQISKDLTADDHDSSADIARRP